MSKKRTHHVFTEAPRPFTPTDFVNTLKTMRPTGVIDIRRFHLRMRNKYSVYSSESGVEVVFQKVAKAGLGKVIHRKAPLGPKFIWKEPYSPDIAIPAIERLLIKDMPAHVAVPAAHKQSGGRSVSFKWGSQLGSLDIPNDITKEDIRQLMALLSVIEKSYCL